LLFFNLVQDRIIHRLIKHLNSNCLSVGELNLVNDEALQKIRSVADYQFCRGAGKALFPRNVSIKFSKATGRIRHIYLKNRLLATLRPTDGFLGLTVFGGERLKRAFKPPRFRVIVRSDIGKFIKEGKSVFAKHVEFADPEIRPMDEVVVVDEKDKVLAVGRALLSGEELLAFERGVAVKVRHGILE
jgi:predicted RNA-binding protein (TIGR00451 family)